MKLELPDGATMHYEIHGHGPPAVAMGGWGTFCHGAQGGVPRAVTRRFTTAIFDYRGIGESTDVGSTPATTAQYAADLSVLLDHLGWTRVHVVGMVGMGACVGQELVLARPDLAASLVMTGTWARVDPTFRDQIEGFRRAHLDAGFATFQLLVAAFSFTHHFYNANRDRLIGPEGAWAALQGREAAHSRLIDACLSHDTLDRLPAVNCPTLVVHAGRDVITRPDMTRLLEDAIPSATGVDWPELAHVVAGGEERRRFDEILADYYDGIAAGTDDEREG